MKRFKQVKTRLLLFLILGILLLSIGFISCGTGPQTKTTVANSGAYAVDFNAAPSDLGFIDLSRSIDSMAGLTGFTIEAWVKSTVNSPNLTGGIFSRSSDAEGGILLYIASNEPRFTMVTGGTLYTVQGTSTTFPNGTWTHVAVVLAPAHTASDHVTTATCTGAIRGESPHLDIYIDGNFNNCASTSSNYPAAFSTSERIGRLHSNFSGNLDFTGGAGTELATKLNAVIDEVRFWRVARTASQINQCRTQELGVSGACMITSDLIGYWRLNEGTGTAIYDASGTGNGGTKYYCEPGSSCESGGTSILWEGGWTTGYPF